MNYETRNSNITNRRGEEWSDAKYMEDIMVNTPEVAGLVLWD